MTLTDDIILTKLLGRMVKDKRGSNSLQYVADNIKVSKATLSRIEQGKTPDLETFIKVCQWLCVPMTVFVFPPGKPVNEAIAREAMTKRDEMGVLEYINELTRLLAIYGNLPIVDFYGARPRLPKTGFNKHKNEMYITI